MENYQLFCEDSIKTLQSLPDASIQLIISDWPYFGVKSDEWDNQWNGRDDFLGWIDAVCEQYQRVLAPNGSLYAFASPQMSWHVEGVMRNRFNVLNRITWAKDAGWHQKADEEVLRGYFPATETVLFCEQFNSDNTAMNGAGYNEKRDQPRVFVFEPIREYLVNERNKAGLTTRQVAIEYQKKTGSRTVTGMAGHWFEKVQWVLPTEENYHWLRETFAKLNHGGDYLRREYEDLRREYEDLRRPFNTTPQLPYTDVWTYPTVNTYNGKHPCEKPLQMMMDIITISSREGDTVADFFFGSGVSGQAAGMLKRNYIGVERDPRHFDKGRRRIATAYRDWDEAMTTRETVLPGHTEKLLPLWEMALNA